MPTSSVVSQGDLAIADHINNVRTDVLSTHTHDGTDGNATIEATSFTGTATYTGASLTFGDEDLLRWGTNADVVSLLRSTALSADTELSGIIEGTSDHPGVAANSLIISNITDDGDIMFVVSDGGNSKGLLKLDGANGKVTIHGGDLEVAEALTVTGATTLNGNVTLGNAASDVITVNGTVAGANALIFEGATADGSEITLAAVDPTSDHTIYMPNQGGYLGVFAAASTTQISSTPAELNILDGATVVVGEINYLDLGSTAVGTAIASKAVILDSNKDYDGLRNLTITGELDAATLDLSGAADIAGDLVLSGGADGALQFTNAGENSIKIPDNQGSALIIEEADNAYMTFVTTDSSEAVTIAKTLTLSTVAAAGTDTDKFLVLDSSGNVDYRTGTEVLSDIGASSASGTMSSFQLEDDDGTEVTISDAKEVKIIGSGVTTNWTDTDNGTDGDPYDLTITVDAAQTGITSILATDVKIGEDDQTKIDFETADEIHFYVANAHEVTLAANELSPNTSDGIALGTSSKMWSDLFLASGAVINFNNGDITATHSSNTLTIAGGTLATAALTASTGVFSGILKTDDATEATSTTDGSLQTDGGLSVVKDAVFGDDVKLLSDGAVLAFGADGDVTLTHDADDGLELNDSTFLGFASAAGTPATDNKVQGIVIEFLAVEAITQFDAVYVSTTTGRVGRADANDAAKLPAIGIAIEAQGSAGSSVRVLTHGVYRDDGGFGGNMTVGADLYVSETPGTLTTTAPGDDGDFVQVMGVAVGVRSAFINPDMTIIEVA
jgi:hypothetical protein